MREWQLSTTHAEEARLGQTLCGHGVHKPDTTRHELFGASVSHHTATIARLLYRFAGRVVLHDFILNFESYIEPAPNASKIINYPPLYEELVTFV